MMRHTRIRALPYQTQALDALLERCVRAAEAAGLDDDHEWHLYKEPPGRYWLIWFSDDGEFAYQHGPDPLANMARTVARARSEALLAEVDAMLSELDYEIEWSLLTQQKSEWSTVESMSTATHPKARVMLRTIVEGAVQEFDAALQARTAFFGEHDYPLPVEGFVCFDGAPHLSMQVVFPVAWPAFHARESFGAFVKSLDDEAQADYARRKAALMKTMRRAEFYDANAARELSYQGAPPQRGR